MQNLRNILKRKGNSRLRHILRALQRDERGVSAILVAGAMVFMLSVGTIAVDAGVVMMRDRKLQNTADIAAIAASHDITRATQIIEASIQDNGYSLEVIQSIEPGTYDPAQPPASRFTPGAGGNAVRLTLVEDVSLFFMPTVSETSTATVGAQSIATNVDEGAFSATTGVLSLEDGILNSMLNDAIGTNVSLTLIDYQGLAQTHIDALSYFDALATEVGVSAGTYNDLLATSADMGDIVNAAISVLQADPSLDSNGTTALAALETLAAEGNVLESVSFQVHELFDFGTLGLRDIGSGGRVTDITAGVAAFDLLFQSLYSGKVGEIMDLGLAINVPGLVNFYSQVAVGEPLIGDPSNPEARIVVGPVGARIHTSPMRIYVEAQLLNLVNLPVLGLQSVRIPLYVEMARGDAVITGISCGPNPGSDSLLSIRGDSGAADLYIGDIDPSTPMSNFSQPVQVNPATLVWIPLVARIKAESEINVDGSGPQNVVFTGPEMAIPVTKTVGDSLTLTSALSALGTARSVTVDRGILAVAAGLLGVTDALLIAPVEAAILTVLAPIEQALGTITRALGVQVGYMDLTGLGVRCGAPALVG